LTSQDNGFVPASESEKFVKAFTDYVNSQESFCVDNANVMEIMPYLYKLQNEKGKAYGRSWCKHSDMSAFFNLERKWDRIQNIMERAMTEGVDNVIHSDKSATSTETFVDTVVDLALYALMWAGYIRETHPEEWEKFVKANELD
jgi:hypothetical protein